MKKISLGIILSLITFYATAESEVVSIKTQSNIAYEFVNPYRPGEGLKRVVGEEKYGDFTNIITTDDNTLYAYNILSCDIPKTGISSHGIVEETLPQSGFYKIRYPSTERHARDGNCFGVYKIIKP